ncbi:hypothetical protein HWV62_15437 [Athelia sp. TMB]|nr:hypothetical protein HWV62_15437 [Athelia sp. TMB]
MNREKLGSTLAYVGGLALTVEKKNCDPLILDLIPYTRVNAYWIHYDLYCDRRFYWLDDIEAARDDLQAYRQNVTLFIPGAEKAFEKFIAKRKRKANKTVEYGDTCHIWLMSVEEEARRRRSTIREQRRKDIYARLIALGHDVRDFDGLVKLPGVIKLKPLSDKGWTKIQDPILESVNLRKTVRIAREHKAKSKMEKRAPSHGKAYYNCKHCANRATNSTSKSNLRVFLITGVLDHIKAK